MRVSTRTLFLHENGRQPEAGALLAYYVEAARQEDKELLAFLTRAIDELFPVGPGWRFEWNMKQTGPEGMGTLIPPPTVKPAPKKRGKKR
jgi:hypothetical protein